MSSTGRAWCTGCWQFYNTKLSLSPVVSPSFDFLQFQNEDSIVWFYAVTQGARFVPGFYLGLPSSSPYPSQLYIRDTLYRHLVHIEDCHCHLLIITVTCTLHSAINTYHWRAMAPQHLFRPLQSWWERELAAKRDESQIQCNTQGINCSMMCLLTNLQWHRVKRIYLY